MSEAVSGTLELESYLVRAPMQQAYQSPQENRTVSAQSNLVAMLYTLMEKLQKLENDMNERQGTEKMEKQPQQRQNRRRHRKVICHKCEQPGHYTRGCANIPPHVASTTHQAEGKVPLPMSQVCDSNQASPNGDMCTITINSVSNYTLHARVFNDNVSFLVDTGAAVSLVSSKVWNRIKPPTVPRMNSVNLRLVGVDGAPLQIQGSVTVDLEISGKIFKQELIVVNALTSEGILGLNFLEANSCVLDLARGELLSGGTRIALSARQLQENSMGHVEVVLPETLTIAATSEMEVMGKMPENCEGIWMVEDKPTKKHLILIARAIVAPKKGQVPLRIINLDCKPTTIYKGTKVASAEDISNIMEILSVDETNDSCYTDQEWKKVLDDVLSTMQDTFSDYQLAQFSALLTSYAHIFAYKPGDIGRTDVLSHRIETNGNPIRQAVRRVPLPQRDEIKKLLTDMQEKRSLLHRKAPGHLRSFSCQKRMVLFASA